MMKSQFVNSFLASLEKLAENDKNKVAKGISTGTGLLVGSLAGHAAARKGLISAAKSEKARTVSRQILNKMRKHAEEEMSTKDVAKNIARGAATGAAITGGATLAVGSKAMKARGDQRKAAYEAARATRDKRQKADKRIQRRRRVVDGQAARSAPIHKRYSAIKTYKQGVKGGKYKTLMNRFRPKATRGGWRI